MCAIIGVVTNNDNASLVLYEALKEFPSIENSFVKTYWLFKKWML